MRILFVLLFPLLICLGGQFVTGCSEYGAGSFQVIFQWLDGAPSDAVWVSARVEKRGSVDGTPPVTIAEAPIVPYSSGQRLQFSDLPYGSGYVVVVEIKEEQSKASKTLYFGESDSFSLVAGKQIQVAVRLHLTETPSADDPSGAVSIAEPLPVEGVIGRSSVSLAFAAQHASRVVVANDQSFSLGVSEARLESLTLSGEQRLWTDWNLDQGLCDLPPCPDGPRRVFVKFLNDQDYSSPIYSAQVVLDQTAPRVTGANLVREPFFAPALGDHSTWFSSRDPQSDLPVSATLYVYADEPLADQLSLTCSGPDGAELTFALSPLDSQLEAGIAAFSHKLGDLPGAPDGDYTFSVSWSDGLGNGDSRDVPWILSLHNAPPTGSIDLDQTVFVRAEWGDTESAGVPSFSLRGRVVDPQNSDVARLLILTSDDQAVGYRIAAVDVGSDGSFQAPSLPAWGVARLFLAPIGRSGSIGASQGVRFSEWLASLGQETPGSDHPNPHSFVSFARAPHGLISSSGLVPSAHGHDELAQLDGLSATSTGQPVWREVTSNQWSPKALNYSAMVYDSARSRVVRFGGDMNPGALNETWEWNGDNWDLLFPTVAPAPRNSHAMAYDNVRGVSLLFGGHETQLSSETWQWDGSAWSMLDVPGPSARSKHSMAFDSSRAEVVLFGGESATGFENDTWIWDGDSWSESTPAVLPEPRSGQAMAYDAGRMRVVMFGGEVFGNTVSETWEWDGQSWELRCDGQPASDVCSQVPDGLRNGALAYDRRRGVTVLYGGWLGDCVPSGCRSDQTWEWDGSDWTKRCDGEPADDLCAGSPPAAMYHTLAYDSARERVVFTGARTNSVETWEFDGRVWADRTPQNPAGRIWHAMTYYPTSARVFLFGGLPTNGTAADTWEWDGGWTLMEPANSPSARYGHALTAQWQDGVVLLYGGSSGGAETWRWNGLDWQQLYPADNPGDRRNHSLAYDPVRNRVVLYGGRLNGSIDDETWEWNGVNWERPTLALSPEPRQYQSMAFDVARGESVLFGGQTSSGPSDETWLYDGSWRLANPAVRPPALDSHVLAYDFHRRTVVLTGGSDVLGDYNDSMWEWDGSSWAQIVPDFGPAARGWHDMVFHPGRGQMILFGGPNQLNEESWVLEHAANKPGQVLQVNLDALDPAGSSGATLLGLVVRAVVGGEGQTDAGPVHPDNSTCNPVLEACLADYRADPGAMISIWMFGQWSPLVSNTASTGSPEMLEWSAGIPQELPSFLFGDALHFAINPVGFNGTGQASLATDYVEVKVRMCHDGPDVCQSAQFPE